MADENDEVVQDETVEDEVVAPEVTEEEAEPQEEDIDWKTEAEKAKELANNYKVRAEKAEKKAKEAPAIMTDGLASKDVIYLAKADIHEDDVDEVLDIARAKKISISKAHEYLKPILEVRKEQRSTANAANVSNVRRGSSKMTDETLLSNADNGKLPDGDEDIARLIAAKAKQKSN